MKMTNVFHFYLKPNEFGQPNTTGPLTYADGELTALGVIVCLMSGLPMGL